MDNDPQILMYCEIVFLYTFVVPALHFANISTGISSLLGQ